MTQSAFHPVSNINNFTFFIGYEEQPKQIQNESICCSSRNEIIEKSEEKKPMKRNKKKWTREEKLKAIEIVKSMGIQKGLIHLQQNLSKTYFKLTISTLQYWWKQNNEKSCI